MKIIKFIALAMVSASLSGCMFLLPGSGMGMGSAKLLGNNLPEAYENLSNPVKSNKDNLIAGKNLYNNNCLRCHGKTAQGNGPDSGGVWPRPANLQKTMNRFITVKDNDLFYSISEGKNDQKSMPAFKNILTSEERWMIVNYLKTFRE